MPGFAAFSYKAQQLDGQQEPLGPISSVGHYKVKQNAVDGDVYATVNGGPWVKIIDSSGLVIVVPAGSSQTIATLKASTPIGPSSNVETSVFGGGVAGSLTIPAGTLNVLGKTLRVRMWGIGSSKGNPTGGTTLKLKLGATTIFSTAPNILGNLPAAAFGVNFDMTVQTIGATGALLGRAQTTGLYWSQPTDLGETVALGTPDLTSALALDFTWKYATSDINNFITVQGCTVEIIGP